MHAGADVWFAIDDGSVGTSVAAIARQVTRVRVEDADGNRGTGIGAHERRPVDGDAGLRPAFGKCANEDRLVDFGVEVERRAALSRHRSKSLSFAAYSGAALAVATSTISCPAAAQR